LPPWRWRSISSLLELFRDVRPALSLRFVSLTSMMSYYFTIICCGLWRIRVDSQLIPKNTKLIPVINYFDALRLRCQIIGPFNFVVLLSLPCGSNNYRLWDLH
jgi:hypothetical protein